MRRLAPKILLPARARRHDAIVGHDADRRVRIVAMGDSLIEMFGCAALPVALSQSGMRDVAGASGIRWFEVVEALLDR